MNAKAFYGSICGLEYIGNCTNMPALRCARLLKGKKRANKVAIHKIVLKYLPLTCDSALFKLYNPYSYYRTSTHIIFVHSAIEYFFKIVQED